MKKISFFMLTSGSDPRIVRVMNPGVITSIDSRSQKVTVADYRGEEYSFSYLQGQSFFLDGSDILPQFTGRHDQPAEGTLKHPKKGDLVVFSATDMQVEAWGYMASLVACASHRFASGFASNGRLQDA